MRCGVAALRRCGVAALRRCGVAALRLIKESSERLMTSTTEQQKNGGQEIIRASKSCKREMSAKFEDFQNHSNNQNFRLGETMLGSRAKHTALRINRYTNSGLQFFSE